MDIILDSNIYRSDFLLRSNDFDALLDYLRRTSSSIYFPQIVLDEIKELHKRALKERIQNGIKSLNNLKLLLTDESVIAELPVLDENAESDKYIDFVKKKLKIFDRNVLQPKESYFSEVTRRAIQREKPCGEDGQGFRDTIIWLTLKDFCSKSTEKQITFISNNDKDFANADKTELHDSLKKECELLEIKINYFKSIRDFIEKLSKQIDFITEDWIWDKLDKETFDDDVINYLNNSRTNVLSELVTRKTGNDCTGHTNVTYANIHSLPSFYVYEMLDGSYIANVTFECEIEVEYEYYTNEYNEYYRYPQAKATHQYFNTEIYASLTIKDREIVEYEIDDFYL